MFVRFTEFDVKWEKKAEFNKLIKTEILPILKKQVGFLEVLPFYPENTKEFKAFSLTFWANKADLLRYEKEWYPKVYELMKPYIDGPITVKYFNLEETLCEHFLKTYVA